jgi:two-component system response regulator AtoC
VADDDPSILKLVQRVALGEAGLETTLADSGSEAMRLLASADSFDMVLTDIRMPGNSGLDVLHRVRQLSADIPVVVMSAVAEADEMLALQSQGATLFLRKPFGIAELQLLLRHGHHLASQLRAARYLYQVAPKKDVRIPGLVGRSPAFVRALVHLSALAKSDATLLIEGETGTGKELVARAAHQLSARKDKPFVAVNCSAISESLLDSELFGHVKGSFTGAVRDNPGLFRAADEGTLFLDEIGELSLAAQARMLRVLQEHEVRPVGSVKPVKVNVRLLAATHRDLAAMVSNETFRQDLYYRLRVGEVRLPPLRERHEDVLLLAYAFLEKSRQVAGGATRAFAPDAVQAMLSHPWPGNVRELEATVTRAAAVATGGIITSADMEIRGAPFTTPPWGHLGAALSPRGAPPNVATFADAKQSSMDAFERSYLTRLLAEVPSLTLAASRAGMDRKSLYRLLKKHGLGRTGTGGDEGEGESEESETGQGPSGRRS